MALPPVIESFVIDFAGRNELQDLSREAQFEHLIAFLLFRRAIHDRFSTSDVVTTEGETGVDGAAVVLDGNLILTEEDAEAFFRARPGRTASIVAEFLFCQAKTSHSFEREKILGFGDAVVELLDSAEPSTPQSEYLLEVRRIYKVVVRNAAKLKLDKARCSLDFCCLGDWSNQAHARAAMKSTEERIRAYEFFGEISFNPTDRDRIRKLWLEATREQEATLATVSRFPFPSMPDVGNAVVALVRGTDFVDSVLRDSSGNLRIGIFDQNIRDFEGMSNEVNEKIGDTLGHETKRSRFGIMNNGITIVAREIESAADAYILRNYQIINGCQTSNVLHRARESLSSDVLLQVRLIQTISPTVLNDVVQATNSQTQVPSYQFAANAKVVVDTYEFFKVFPVDPSYRLHFERRHSEFHDAEISNTRIVTIPDLARTFAAIFLEEPHTVASAPNQTHALLKEKLFLDHHLPLMYYTAAFAYYRFYLLKVRSALKIPEARLYWHVLTCARKIAAGPQPSLSVGPRKMEKYCNKFLERLWQPADALTLFEEAYAWIQDHTEKIDRDRLRRLAFTKEYMQP